MYNFTILHLSDLHFDVNNDETITDLHTRLLNDIQLEMQYSDNIIIVVSGDLYNQGSSKKNKIILDFFRKLHEILGEKVIDVIIVPGNHDKKLDNDKQKYKNGFINYDILHNPEPLDSDWKKQEWKFFNSSFSNFKNLKKDILDIFEIENNSSCTYECRVVNIEEHNILFVLLNTSWLCQGHNDERRKLRIGNFQLQELNSQYKKIKSEKNIDLVIAVGHHPLNWFTGYDQDLITNSFLSKEGLNVDTYLCGHTHNRDIVNWYNNTKSLLTLVSGIGWPNTNHGEIPQNDEKKEKHTYSSYVFNLDINSIDVYVRSTNDNDEFNTDFSMYKNDHESKEKKITVPIKMRNNKSYFVLYTGVNRSNKSYYFNEKVVDEMLIVSKHISELKYRMKTILDKYVLDFLKAINNNIDIDKENGFNTYQEELLIGNGKNKSPELIDLIKKNKQLVLSNFENYLGAICENLGNLIVEAKWNNAEDFDDLIRLHFRYCQKEENNIYKKLIVKIPNYDEDKLEYADYELSDMEWEDLLEASWKEKHSLVYSVNKNICKKPIKDVWHNFITAIPNCNSNYFSYRNDKRPLLTFGITVNHQKYDDYLYALSFFEFENVLSSIIDDYLNTFNIEISQFSDYCMKGMKEDE